MILKEEFEKIKKIEGKTIGLSIKEDLDFVLKKEGKEGVKKIEKAMEKLGYPLKYEKVKKYQWYPLTLNILVLVVAKDLFGWNDKELQDLGRTNAKTGFIMKIMLRFFVSLKLTLEGAGEYWERYFTTGKLTAEEIQEKEHYAFLVLKDFTGHPTFCRVLEGYFWQVFSYVLPKESLKVKETDCFFQEGGAHRFKITW